MHLDFWAAQTWDGDKTHSPSEFVSLRGTWEPEQFSPGNCMKCSAHVGLCPCRPPWSLSSVDPGSTCHLGLWQTQCGPSTVSNPHTYEQYLFAVSLPPYKTTEQVSLSKWPPLPPHVRAEIRHCKQRKPNFFFQLLWLICFVFSVLYFWESNCFSRFLIFAFWYLLSILYL